MDKLTKQVTGVSDSVLRVAQLRMLDILIEIDRICRKHSIKYWIDFGTLLGAVRHKGFIPWDDDLDICIFEEDYSRFLSICENELSPRFFLQTDISDPTSAMGNGLCKIRDKESLYIEATDNFKKPYQKGIFVDVFESITYPNISPKVFKFLSRRISFSYGFFKYNPSLNLKNIICFFIYPISYSFFSSIFKLLLLNKGNYLFSRPEFYGSGFFTKKTDIFPLKEVEFEGRMFFAPFNPDARLRDNFGDYMKIPSENQRRTHAKYIFIESSIGKI